MPTALVTGSAKRIGRVIALALADAGYDIVVHPRSSPDEAADAVAEIERKDRRAVALAADLAVEAETAALIGRAAEALGTVSVLVNSASVFQPDEIAELTREGWDEHLETNLRAPIVLAQAFAAALPADAEGVVINILDQRVLRPNPQFISYTVSKMALWAATKTMAQALAPRIRVNGVGPGPTLPSVHQPGGEFEAEAAAIPLERAVRPEEIAAAVIYFVGARSVTGQMIAVDGGQHLAWRTPDVEVG